MVKKPKKLIIKNLPFSYVELPNHPTTDMGKRKIEFDKNFYLSEEDTKDITVGTKLRLMGLGNITITRVENNLEAEYLGDDIKVDFQKLQWIPENKSHQLKIIIPKKLFINDKFNEDSLEELEVYTEPHYLELKDGTEIQFVRFGYCKKDSANQAIYTHK